MNKKFSTLVAGILLASSVGIAGVSAQTVTPVYSKFTKAGSVANSLRMKGAYQLTNAEGTQALAMISTDGGKTFVLKMVSTTDATKANLAETLWKIESSDNVEGGPSFTFVSAAYDIPLSFNPAKADKDGLANATEFPGTNSVWKWQPQIEATSANPFEVEVLKDNFSYPDSAMVLAAKSGKVGAVKYATKNGVPAEAVALMPKVVSAATLTADDLNSMLMTQDWQTGLLSLGFDKNVSENAKNLWTNDYKAVKAVGTNLIALIEKQAAEDALKAAKDVQTGAGVATVIRAMKSDAKYKKYADLLEDMAKVAETKSTATAAVDAIAGLVTEAGDKYFDADKLAKANEAYAEEIQTAIGLWEPFDYDDYLAAVEEEDLAPITDGTAENIKGKVLACASKDGFSLTAAQEELAKVVETYADAAKVQSARVAAADAILTEMNKLSGSWTTNAADLAAFKTTVEKLVVLGDESKGYESGDVQAVKATIIENAEDIYGDGQFATFGTNYGNEITTPEGDAKTLAEAKEKYVEAIQTAVTDDKYVSTKAEATAKIKAVKETAGDLSADQVKAVQDAFIAILPDAGIPTTKDVSGVIADYTDAATAAAKDLEIATEISDDYVADYDADKVVEDNIKALKLEEDAADYMEEYNSAIDAVLADKEVAGASTADAVADAIEAYIKANEIDKITGEYTGYVSLQVPDSDPNHYLRVDTTFLTGSRGSKHLAFETGKFNGALTNSEGNAVATYTQHDFNGRYNFQFTYFPTQDSLVITTPKATVTDDEITAYGAGYAHPLADVNYADMSNAQIKESWKLHSGKHTGKHVTENVVKIVVLNDDTKHREVTVGYDEKVEATNADPATTLNTRIYLLVSPLIKADITPGVYTIKYISDDQKVNNRYLVNNYLQYGQAMAIDKEEIQNVLHIPAAQWVITHENGSYLNSILNRETGWALVKAMDYGNVQQQYLYKTETENVYQNKFGDKFLLNNVTEKVNGDEYLGYFHATEADVETEANVYAFRYLNETEGLYITMNEDSTLRVSPVVEEGAEKTYLELEPWGYQNYGAAYVSEAAAKVATPLKRHLYRLRLVTDNKNENSQDKLYVYSTVEGKYKFFSETEDPAWQDKKYATFMLKEFNEVDTCYYALIDWQYDKKVSVDDYPSNLVVESLEAQADYGNGWGYLSESRSSVFALESKEAPMYRRLGVTNPEDGLTNIGTNNAKINVTREANRYLYENTTNKVAGYEADPTGLNYLGAQFSSEKAAMFIDTAYVRNNTTRPQYMLAVRPDFTPALVDCEADPTHPKHEVAQVRANYLVSLADSVDAYRGDKKMMDKFMYENRTYIRLAFVDAIHRGDSLIIMDSKFKGAELAGNDTIDLSKNAFNEGAWQFRLTKNFDETAEFLIEGPRYGQFVRLVNGVAVLTYNINDAERFNIAKTDENPTANDEIAAEGVSVVATNGAVIIKGAEGKNVVITNVLGQQVANTVVTSSEATIAAPAGVVIVAVEGEAAVKAIVK